MGDLCPQDGQEHKDSWGTVYIFKPGAPGAHPHVTPENAVIKDIEKWEEQLTVPDLDHLDWTEAVRAAEAVNRKEKFVGFMCAGGLFERSHHLMGSGDCPDQLYGISGGNGGAAAGDCGL